MRIPADRAQSLPRESCAGNQHFLLPVARGSATVAVPLSLDTQAARREEGRGRGEGDGGSRRDKGRGRERPIWLSPPVSLFLFFSLVGWCLAENSNKSVNNDRRRTMCKMSHAGL